MQSAISSETATNKWKSLYLVSGVAALVATIFFRRNLAAEYMLFRSLGVFRAGPRALPVSVLDWFGVLQNYRFIGLTLLNLFDILNYALVALLFFGLSAALRRLNRGAVTLALLLAAIAVAVYFASNQAFAMLSLSDQYAAAATDAQRNMLLAAGQALLAIQNSNASYGNGIYISYLLINLAGLILAVVMLRSRAFGKLAAWCGILANVFGLGYYITFSFSLAVSAIPISIAAVFLLIWYILTGLKLLRLASGSLQEDL
jgi:hypothetical protein